MAHETLKKHLAKQMTGVQADRIAVRAQGCWNCVHGSYEKANELWWKEVRAKQLEKGVQLALASPLGEKHPSVLAIRRNVPLLDASMVKNEWIACRVGKKPDGSAVADFVHRSYLCDRWTATGGASVAREGGKLDKLPEELTQLFDSEGKTD